MSQDFSHYTLREIDLPNNNPLGITYDVTVNFEVLVCKTYTRHVNLAEAAGVKNQSITWGGILSNEGEWVRKSLDFGDAPSIEEREYVVKLINEHYGL